MKRFFSIALLLIFSTLAFAEKPIVRDIQAVGAKGTKINIFWTLPQNPDEPITKLLLYRDTKPISSYEIIETLDPIAQIDPEFTGYTDSVKDYQSYMRALGFDNAGLNDFGHLVENVNESNDKIKKYSISFEIIVSKLELLLLISKI